MMRALRNLLPRARRDEISRVVIALDGGADISSVLAMLAGDAVVSAAYHLTSVTVHVAEGDIVSPETLIMADCVVLAPGIGQENAELLTRGNPTAQLVPAPGVPKMGQRPGQVPASFRSVRTSGDAGIYRLDPPPCAAIGPMLSWLTGLTARYGRRIQRIRGLLHVGDGAYWVEGAGHHAGLPYRLPDQAAARLEPGFVLISLAGAPDPGLLGGLP